MANGSSLMANERSQLEACFDDVVPAMKIMENLLGPGGNELEITKLICLSRSMREGARMAKRELYNVQIGILTAAMTDEETVEQCLARVGSWELHEAWSKLEWRWFKEVLHLNKQQLAALHIRGPQGAGPVILSPLEACFEGNVVAAMKIMEKLVGPGGNESEIEKLTNLSPSMREGARAAKRELYNLQIETLTAAMTGSEETVEQCLARVGSWELYEACTKLEWRWFKEVRHLNKQQLAALHIRGPRGAGPVA